MSANELGDIWTGKDAPDLAGAPAHAAPLIGVQSELIEGIALLDMQFGVDPKKSVPDGLQDELFGPVAATPADIARAGNDADAVPPMATFAVLDAANVTNLPEILAASGLEHHCLFIGDAKDELSDVAPWVVHLEPDHPITRNLFTTGGAAWQLWDKNPGLILRARATCEGVQKHFRKILKVQDDSGKWFYFRFWEGATLMTVAQSSPDKDLPRLYFPGMIAYARHATPQGPALLKSWVAEGGL